MIMYPVDRVVNDCEQNNYRCIVPRFLLPFFFFFFFCSLVARGSDNDAGLRISNRLPRMGIRVLRNRDDRPRVERSLVSFSIRLPR